MAIAHVPPNRVKEAYFILKSFKLKTKAENNFKKNILRYMNKQWLNNPNMPMSHWNLWRRNKNLTNNSHESFNGRLKDKIQKHNPNPYLLQKHLKAEMLNSRDKLQDFELCENPQRRYLKQERINKKRKMCKTRLKTDPQYNLEKYMFAMGNYCIKSSLGFGEPLNDSMVQSPKLLAKEKYKKKTSAPENMSSFESPKTDGSESDFSDVSYVLPNQTTNSHGLHCIASFYVFTSYIVHTLFTFVYLSALRENSVVLGGQLCTLVFRAPGSIRSIICKNVYTFLYSFHTIEPSCKRFKIKILYDILSIGQYLYEVDQRPPSSEKPAMVSSSSENWQ